MKRTIYFDNAATSWPKPEGVGAAMEGFLREVGANAGRSGHERSMEAGRRVYEARAGVARLFGMEDELWVLMTKNATEALNLAMLGTLGAGDHAITSVMEHNSVLRPLRALEERGVEVTRVADAGEVERAVRANSRMVVMGHGSNVTGALNGIGEVGRVARAHGLLFCVDAAQTAGCVRVAMEEACIDLLAFSGHKGLYGPQGTGGLCVGERARAGLEPLMYGGTGSGSESDEQPGFAPDRYEAGTMNVVGLAGLAAGLRFVEERGVEGIRAHEMALTGRLLEGMAEIGGVRVLGPKGLEARTAVVSFNVEGRRPEEVAGELEERVGVCCRAGLHCAPMAHRALGTFPQGAVRFGLGAFNTAEEVDAALDGLREIAMESGRRTR